MKEEVELFVKILEVIVGIFCLGWIVFLIINQKDA